jgi:hypothetical protein
VPNADLLGRELRHTGFWLLTWLSTAPRSEIVDTYRYLSSLVADGSLSVPVEATYRLDDYHRALEHAGAPKRGGKVLFALDERQYVAVEALRMGQIQPVQRVLVDDQAGVGQPAPRSGFRSAATAHQTRDA